MTRGLGADCTAIVEAAVEYSSVCSSSYVQPHAKRAVFLLAGPAKYNGSVNVEDTEIFNLTTETKFFWKTKVSLKVSKTKKNPKQLLTNNTDCTWNIVLYVAYSPCNHTTTNSTIPERSPRLKIQNVFWRVR